jgi:hypothetical protein
MRRGRAAATVAIALVCVSLVLGGCAKSKKPTAAAAPTTSDRTTSLSYKLHTTGDLAVSIDGSFPVRVFTIVSPDDRFSGLTLLSVGPAEALAAGTARVRAAFDLTRYKGDGSYRIKAGSPRDLLAVAGTTGPAPDQSNVLFQVWADGKTDAQPEVFDKAIEPCPLTVKDSGHSGRLQCPRLTNDSGKTFSLDMRWGKQ